MKRDYIAWDSPSLGRRMELLYFGDGGRPMIWFPTSKGHFPQAEDFGLIGAVADLIDGRAIQVACVDGVDEESFYAGDRHPAERLARHQQYDRYLSEEVVPLVRARARTDGRLATLGCSFGAYHAVNFGFRHPDLVSKVVGLSGKYDIHSFLDGYWDDLAYYHCPTAYVANMGQEWVRRLSALDTAIVTGELDNIVEGSRQLIAVLQSKGIPHRGHIWGAPYGHDWPWWRIQIRHYI
jgi:esterase/lipase superfamily enzyme